MELVTIKSVIPVFYEPPSGGITAIFRFSRERSDRQKDGRTDRQTDGRVDRRTLPSTLSPSLRGR